MILPALNLTPTVQFDTRTSEFSTTEQVNLALAVQTVGDELKRVLYCKGFCFYLFERFRHLGVPGGQTRSVKHRYR